MSDAVGIWLAGALLVAVLGGLVASLVQLVRGRYRRRSFALGGLVILAAAATLVLGALTVESDGGTCMSPAILDLLPDSADQTGMEEALSNGVPPGNGLTCNQAAHLRVLPPLVVTVGMTVWWVVEIIHRRRKSRQAVP